MRSNEQLRQLSQNLYDNLDSVLDDFGLSLTKWQDQYRDCCLIHEGDNRTSLNVYPSAIWRCYTRQCHDVFRPSLLGFFRALLSKRYCRWQRPGDRLYGFGDTIRLAERLKPSEAPQGRFEQGITHENRVRIRREYVRQNLQIPSKYFLGRGFSETTLEKYDVGDCWKIGRKMYGRAVIPIYLDQDVCVGCSGRSVYEKCPKCSGYHPNIPCPNFLTSKWRHSPKLPRTELLYNWQNVKKLSPRVESIILVEGPLDVLKLEQCGVVNSVACFGTGVSERQIIMLEDFSVKNILVAFDNDKPGNDAAMAFSRKYKKRFQLRMAMLPEKDFGDMSTNQVGRFCDANNWARRS
jgi:5S rRNA maturation endonuclease (ribonuclease M5)